MAEKPDNPDRLDEMLRSWGAEQAVRDAEVPPRRVTTAGSVSSFRRWGPLVAAGLLLAASAVVVLLAGGSVDHGESEPTAMSTGGPGEIRRLKGEVTRLKGEVAASRRALAKAAEQLDRLPQREKALRRELQAEFEELLADRRRQWVQDELGPAMAKLEQMKQTLAERTARVETLEARLASAGGDPNDVARLKRRLAETRDELMAMRLAMKQQQKQVGSLKDRLAERNRRIVRLEEVADRFRKQRGAVEGVERQQKRTWKAMAGLYVEALAPGREGVAAAAYAAGQADLGGRLGDVQRSGDVDEDTRKLLAKLEVIAVRLELLDPTDPDRLASLRAAVRKHRLLERIDDALRRGELSGRLVRLLTETKLFLVGLNREA